MLSFCNVTNGNWTDGRLTCRYWASISVFVCISVELELIMGWCIVFDQRSCSTLGRLVLRQLTIGKPSWIRNQLPSSTQPGHPCAVGTVSASESGDVTSWTGSSRVAWQCKLVSGWGLRRWWSAPSCGPGGWGRTWRVVDRENLVAASEQKENVEKEVFEQRYQLATQRAVRIQLQRAIRDSTSAVSRLLEVRTFLLVRWSSVTILESVLCSLNIY